MDNIFNNLGNTPTEEAVAYMRYSSNNQTEKSIERQRLDISAYALVHNIKVVKEYVDEACTGTNDRRDEFQDLIKDVRSNPTWKKVLVSDMSRFSRLFLDFSKYYAELEDRDIELISVTENFDKSPEGRLALGIATVFNDFYSRNLAKHTFSGLRLKANQAQHCGGVPPLGYKLNHDGKLIIEEEEAKIVKLIFDLYEVNYSYTKMAKVLNDRGYTSKNGKPFTKNSFFSILTQEKYIGTYIWNKAREKNNSGRRNSHKHKPTEKQIILYDAIPAIISKEQFDKVQAMIATRKNGTASSKCRYFYLLAGIDKLKCAECGANLVGNIQRSHGKKYIQYVCPNSRGGTCTVRGIRADHLNKFVVNAVVKDIYEREDLANIFNSIDDKEEITRLKNKLFGLEKASKNILQALRQCASSELTDELRQISEEKKIVKNEIDKLSEEQIKMTAKNRKEICKDIAKAMIKSESLEVKQYLAYVIDSIVVSNNDIELSLNIA